MTKNPIVPRIMITRKIAKKIFSRRIIACIPYGPPEITKIFTELRIAYRPPSAVALLRRTGRSYIAYRKKKH